MKFIVLKSKRPCPVCGNREWYPFYYVMGFFVPVEICDYAVMDGILNSYCEYDICTKCGTMVN
jgi:hypothetical protein